MRYWVSALLLIVLSSTLLISASFGWVHALNCNSETESASIPANSTQIPENLSIGPFVDDFSTDSGLWTMLGSAYRDPINQTLVLTAPNCSEGSAVFFKNSYIGPFTVNFSYWVGGGSWGGDGFTMFFYKQRYPAPGEPQGFSLIRDGETLGFNSFTQDISGYGVEFDEFQNGYDPSPRYVALIKDSTRNHLAYANDLRVGDGTWHNVSVVVGISSVGVYLDNQFILRWDGTLDRTYDNIGLSGATGAATNWHIIGNFSFTASAADLPPAPLGMNIPPPAPTPSPPLIPTLISISADASSSEVGSTVNISGRLTDINGSSLCEDETVILSYSLGDSCSWFPLGSGQTDSSGMYNVQWVPAASGTFALQTSWSGNSTYAGSLNSTTISILPCQNQKVFYVESNSTIAGLDFSVADRTLTFTVSGPNGTYGYTKVTIAKTLIPNISGLTALIDNKAVNFTASQNDETWTVAFTYHHSTHQVEISLGVQAERNLVPLQVIMRFAASAAVFLAITLAFMFGNKKKRSLHRC